VLNCKLRAEPAEVWFRNASTDMMSVSERKIRRRFMARVALVTGGSRGIGEAISKGLKAAGYFVAASYAGNDEAAAGFTAETGIKTYKRDVSDCDSCAAGIAKVEADLGPVDILVNNAGITRDGMFHKMTKDQCGTRSSTPSSTRCST